MLRALTFLACGALAGAAQAACPTSADLDGSGIWVRLSDGAITHYKRNATGNIEETSDYGEGDGYWIEAFKGIYIVNEQSIAQGKRAEGTGGPSTWPVPLEELPDPVPGASFSGTVRYQTKDETRLQETTFRFGPAMNVTIGDCTLAAVPADYVVREAGDDGFAGRILVTELGLSLFVANGTPGQPYSEFYRATEISVEPLE